MNRADRLLLVILLMGTALVAAWGVAMLPPEKVGGLLKQASTFYNVKSGAKATYRVFEKTGVPVRRLQRMISDANLQNATGLVVLDPVVPLTRGESYILQDWIEEGNTLVIVPPDKEACVSCSGETADWEEWKKFSPVSFRRTAKVRNHGESARYEPEDPLLLGITRLQAGEGKRFVSKSRKDQDDENNKEKSFWSDRAGVIGIRMPVGRGRIIALSEPFVITNYAIGKADNSVFLANLMRELSGSELAGTVLFDEYHQGFVERDASPVAIAKLVLTDRWGWAVGQFALVLFLILYAKGLRFGKPLDVVLQKRRRHGEFAASAGKLLQDAGATEIAHRTIWQYYHKRFCRALRLNSDTDDKSLVEYAQTEYGVDIRDLIPDERPGGGKSRLTARRLLSVVRRMNDILEKLEHGSG